MDVFFDIDTPVDEITALGRAPQRWMDCMPVRLAREAFFAFPSRHTGAVKPVMRRLARRALLRLSLQHDGTEFGTACALAAERDAAASDRHAWIGETLRLVADTLERHPYSHESWGIRRDVLHLLDYPLHVRDGEVWRKEVTHFYGRFIRNAIDEIAAAPNDGRLRVWKLYNMGFVVRTPNACVGFDIHPGVKVRAGLRAGQMRRLVEALDVLVISHAHYDHQHEGLIRRMLQAGKPVVLPPRSRAAHGEAGVIRSHHAQERSLQVGSVGVRTILGRQRFFVPNYVNVVDVDGYRVVHTGDNTALRAYEHLTDDRRVDVALVNCWAGYGTLAKRLRPRLIVTGHENELGHIVSLRCGYGFTFRDLERQGLPPHGNGSPAHATTCAVLSWGEGLTLSPTGRCSSSRA